MCVLRSVPFLVFLGICLPIGGSAVLAQQPAAEAVSPLDEVTPQAVDPQQVIASQVLLKPVWKVGQQWEVETIGLQQQASLPQQDKPKPSALRWRFTVAGEEQLGNSLCYRVEIRLSSAPDSQPIATLWVDKLRMTLRQLRTQTTVQGQSRTITEHYQANSNAATPILTPLTALPVDLPAFPDAQVVGHTKGERVFSYKSSSGTLGIKAANSISFSHEISQSVTLVRQLKIKGVREDWLSEIDANQKTVELRLKSDQSLVRQLWQPGRPWPIYTNNGYTESRLVESRKEQAASAESAQQNSATNRPAVEQIKQDPSEKSTAIDSGQSQRTPWSGYWWPIRQGAIVAPLHKYDRLTGGKAAAWEQEHHPSGSNVPDWHGYCHAWAASAVMEQEPVQRRIVQSDSGRKVWLQIGDQKGLLAVCHTRDAANSYGDRFGDGMGSEDKQDLAPDLLWRLLTLYVKQNEVPLILDIEPGEAVWNYPVYSFQVKHEATSNDTKRIATLTLQMADNAVSPSFRGTKVRRQIYRFTFEMRNGSVVAGSGKWTGLSRNNHPDFAWYPFLARGENPHVDYQTVRKLVGNPIPSTSTGEQPSSPPVTTVATTSPSTEENGSTGTPPTAPITAAQDEAIDPIVLSPSELVALINNRTSSFRIDATVDRNDGSVYPMGESFSVRCGSERPGYIYLVMIDSRGVPALLFPCNGENNHINAERHFTFPAENRSRNFLVSGPPGNTRIKVFVTSHPLVLSGQESQTQQQQSARVEQSQITMRAVRPVPFRWHPAQVQQAQQLLASQQQSELAPDVEDLLLKRLGPFAQDEIVFRVTEGSTAPIQQQSSGKPRQQQNYPK